MKFNQVKIFVFGPTNLGQVMDGMGSLATEKDVLTVLNIVENKDPVSLAGLPKGFVPCYNPLSDILDLASRGGCEFEVIELEEDERHDPSEDPYEYDPFVLPDDAVIYYNKVHGIIRIRKTEGWNITDERSDKAIPLKNLLNQFGVFLDPDWDDFMEPYELETVKCSQEEIIARHPMGDGCWAYIHEGDGLKNLSLQDKYYSSLKEWLATDWETDAWGGVPELLAAWRFDAEDYLDKAEEGYEGPCRIWVVRNYFAGNIGVPVDGYLTNESGRQMEFDSFDEAQEWVDEEESGTYLLHTGEVSPPEYIICKA